MLWVLDQPFDNEEAGPDDYPFHDDMVLLKGYIVLSSADTAEQITTKIKEVIASKISYYGEIQYLKRDRNKLSMPNTAEGWVWNFNNLKGLIGQGKLYCRVATRYRPNRNKEDDEINEMVNASENQCSSSRASVIRLEDESDESLPDISELIQTTIPERFHATDNQKIQELESLVHDLLENDKSEVEIFKTKEEISVFFKSKISKEKFKLRVDPKYALEEAFGYFKDPETDTSLRLTIAYKNQSAIDTGGVLRQFFTDVFDQMAEGCDGIPPLFEGDCKRKLPIHNSTVILSGMMEIVGKIISHGIVQCGVGPRFFSPCIYQYIASGNISQSVELASIDDTVHSAVYGYVQKVLDKDIDQAALDHINQEDEFQQLLTESGSFSVLSLANRDSVMQAIIFHAVLGKRAVALNQLRKGLELHGLLEIINKSPDVFKEYFVYDTSNITYEEIREKIMFEEDEEEERSEEIKSFFLSFLNDADVKTLQKFLIFCTGSSFVPTRKITVKFEKSEAILASTCLFVLKLSTDIKTKEHLVQCLEVALETTNKAFSMV